MATSPSQPGRLDPDELTILIEEWKHCEAGIARFDTLQFQIRGWAISTVAALVAATVTLHRWEIALLGGLVAILFWWNEALHDTYQAILIRRVRRVQGILRAHNVGQCRPVRNSPLLSRYFDRAWKKRTWPKIRDTLRSATYVNIGLTYGALILICAAAGAVAAFFPQQSASAGSVTFG